MLVHDADTKGVVIDPTGDTVLRLVEGAIAGQFGATASYTVRLTRSPAAGETVTVVLRPILTPSLDIGGPDCGLPSGCSRLQVEFVAGAGQVLQADGSLRLTFTAAHWDVAQIVTLRAVQDTVIDGNDVQAFPDRARRTIGIQGPLFVSGGDDPNPPVQLSLDGYLPILLPGESSGGPLPITATTADALETAQVDRLVVHNEDSPAADTGVLTGTRITGLGMAGDDVLDGQSVLGGIVYVGLRGPHRAARLRRRHLHRRQHPPRHDHHRRRPRQRHSCGCARSSATPCCSAARVTTPSGSAARAACSTCSPPTSSSTAAPAPTPRGSTTRPTSTRTSAPSRRAPSPAST